MKIEAVFKAEGGGIYRHPVVRFIDGVAMILDISKAAETYPTARLRAANDFKSFVRLAYGDGKIVAALPANGWCAEFREEDGSVFRDELLGWAIDEDGQAVPISMDAVGCGHNPTTASNFIRLCRASDPVTPAQMKSEGKA